MTNIQISNIDPKVQLGIADNLVREWGAYADGLLAPVQVRSLIRRTRWYGKYHRKHKNVR
jgi:hypothetical protein